MNKNTKKTLIVNTGSASRRYALYFGDKLLVEGHLQIVEGKFTASIKYEGKTYDCDIHGKLPSNSVKCFFDKLIERQIIEKDYFIDLIGMRIVAPGEYFTEDRIIDEEYVDKLSKIKESAPLHIIPILDEINHLKETFKDVKMVGISDSNFHKNISECFKIYSIPRIDTEEMGVKRFGYHGISANSVFKKIDQFTKPIPEKIIFCHLGSGASITAIKNGKSYNTSMGFTPLEGITMRTRSGNMGPGALIHLAKKKKFDLEQVEEYFNTKCGLFGLSGIGDTRKIIELSEKGDKNSHEALDIFANDVKEYIGSYTALMNGIDLLIFSGAIGEGSDLVRKKICDKLEYFGIKLDREKNRETIAKDGVIGSSDSKTRVIVILSNETQEIFERTGNKNV